MEILIEIMRAQPQDKAALKEIAIASKGYWGYPEEKMAQWAQAPLITSESIAADLVYVAHLGQAPVGWYRLRLDPAPVTLEDLWVLPAYIGRGVGRSLFEHAVSQAWAHHTAAFELDADPHAVAFYQRMGCRLIGRSLSEWGRYIPRMRYDLPPEIEA
jgi:GNAT superfamily N-acetyltransferase